MRIVSTSEIPRAPSSAMPKPLPIVRAGRVARRAPVDRTDSVQSTLARKLQTRSRFATRPAERAAPADRDSDDGWQSADDEDKPVMVLAQAQQSDDDYDPGPRVMKYIGFKHKPQVSEVFVRLDGKARYKIEKVSDTRVVLELLDTSVNVKNNERPLDTSYFDSAVKPGSGGSDRR